MNGKDRNVEDNFIIGFGNPLCDTPVTSEDKADGVTMLGYRKIDENRKQNGAEGTLAEKGGLHLISSDVCVT